MSYKEHKAELKDKVLRVAVVTFSDTRNESTDKSGGILCELLSKRGGHEICYYEVVNEEQESIDTAISQLLSNKNIEVIVTNGGTGISQRDRTIESVRKYFDKELEGFGEIFRAISYQQIGTAAILSRATAGVVNKKVIFCLPGSSKAVKLATERILLPELTHIHREALR